jgi:hypothetical protein
MSFLPAALAAIAGLFIYQKTRPASGTTPTRAAYDRMTTSALFDLAMQSTSNNISALQQMAASLDARAANGDTLARADSAVIKAKLTAIQTGQTFNT